MAQGLDYNKYKLNVENVGLQHLILYQKKYISQMHIKKQELVIIRYNKLNFVQETEKLIIGAVFQNLQEQQKYSIFILQIKNLD
ncbi:unnamed protein product [Paramecium octaurelia]|uniref:Uncharacterized protein n=1 Tax=Paramecium octaurelia TaxID=43137 RepID=A0A8S1WQF7_PAROT|nr:unnamed protein product [Paramecium octaurelia]